MKPYDEKTVEALNRAIEAGKECYYAFNHLAVITRVDFTFYGTDLHDAIEICKLWKENLEKKGE